ncbi:hypothetical protein LJR056_003551 [Paenibacillus sp. LjRoot56]
MLQQVQEEQTGDRHPDSMLTGLSEIRSTGYIRLYLDFTYLLNKGKSACPKTSTTMRQPI